MLEGGSSQTHLDKLFSSLEAKTCHSDPEHYSKYTITHVCLADRCNQRELCGMCYLKDHKHLKAHFQFIKPLHQQKEILIGRIAQNFRSDMESTATLITEKLVKTFENVSCKAKKQADQDLNQLLHQARDHLDQWITSRLTVPRASAQFDSLPPTTGLSEFLESLENRDKEDQHVWNTVGIQMQRLKHRVLYDKKLEDTVMQQVTQLCSEFADTVVTRLKAKFLVDTDTNPTDRKKHGIIAADRVKVDWSELVLVEETVETTVTRNSHSGTSRIVVDYAGKENQSPTESKTGLTIQDKSLQPGDTSKLQSRTIGVETDASQVVHSLRAVLPFWKQVVHQIFSFVAQYDSKIAMNSASVNLMQLTQKYPILLQNVKYWLPIAQEVLMTASPSVSTCYSAIAKQSSVGPNIGWIDMKLWFRSREPLFSLQAEVFGLQSAPLSPSELPSTVLDLILRELLHLPSPVLTNKTTNRSLTKTHFSAVLLSLLLLSSDQPTLKVLLHGEVDEGTGAIGFVQTRGGEGEQVRAEHRFSGSDAAEKVGSVWRGFGVCPGGSAAKRAGGLRE